MDSVLLLSAGATFDRVHRNGYVGGRSHDGGHRSAIEGTCTVLERILAIRYTLERSGSEKRLSNMFGDQDLRIRGDK